MPETRFARVSDDITLAYEEFGDAAAAPLLLIAGLGAQLISWHEPLCELLAGRGLRVIRFDNRDAGLSTHVDHAYRLEDMAADAAGLLDGLDIESAHVVGVSMGGMIAQALAYEHPERVRSLVSLMSTTGERAVSQPTPEAQEALVRPRSTTPDEAEERSLEWIRVVGSPGLFDEELVRRNARIAFERDHDAAAFTRQLDAIYGARDRTERVRQIAAPTLVIHGELDPLIPPSAGRATATAIDGAELVIIDGMGHDMPPPLWPRLADAIATHVATAGNERGAP
jgi:pimeloyl-ACP methyl ester carboxylesterase